MSSRQLRKLRGNRVFEIANQILEDDQEPEEHNDLERSGMEPVKKSKKKKKKNQQKPPQLPEMFTGEEMDDISDIEFDMTMAAIEVSLDTAEAELRKNGAPTDSGNASANKKKKKKKRRKKKKPQPSDDSQSQQSSPATSQNNTKKSNKPTAPPPTKQQKSKQKQRQSNKGNKQSKPLIIEPQLTKAQRQPRKSYKETFLSKQSKKKELSEVESVMIDFIDNDLDFDIQSSLLRCDARFFDTNYEMRKKFGSDIAGVAASEIAVAAHRSKGKSGKMMRRPVDKKKYLKKTTLITFNTNGKWAQPYQTYANVSGRYTMDLFDTCVDDNSGSEVKYFVWKQDSDYQTVQSEYKEKCASYSPDLIGFLLQRHPYHVDTLLTMSEILTKTGQLEESADLVERALYRMEVNLHSQFSLNDGNCRLSYKIPENRSFFLALWRYSQLVGRRSCVRSALELTKLLLSLSPDTDPLCTLLCLDYWALRAHQDEWVMKFARYWTVQGSNVRILPNWAYATALAAFGKDNKRQNANKSATAIDSCDSSRIPTDLQQLTTSNQGYLSSSILLQQAILLFPEVIAPLLQKANSRLVESPKWLQIMNHKLFLDAKLRRNGNSKINKLISIFVERSSMLWKSDGVLDWLYQHCSFILHRLDNPIIFQDDSTLLSLTTDEEAPTEMEDLSVFDAIRHSIYDDNSGPNRFRMLDVSDFSDVVTTLPELPDAVRPMELDQLDAQMLRGVPPEMLQQLAQMLQAAQGGNADLAARLEQQLRQGNRMQQQHPLTAFLYSMLPWVNPVVAPQPQGEEKQDLMDADNDDDENGGVLMGMRDRLFAMQEVLLEQIAGPGRRIEDEEEPNQEEEFPQNPYEQPQDIEEHPNPAPENNDDNVELDETDPSID